MISEGIGGLFPDAWPSAPLWICAVRQDDGRRVVFGRDGLCPPVPDAVAASCAIPSFFSPVEIGEHGYIDGGVHSPTNADVLRDTALDLVIISSPMSRQGRRPRLAADQAMRAVGRRPPRRGSAAAPPASDPGARVPTRRHRPRRDGPERHGPPPPVRHRGRRGSQRSASSLAPTCGTACRRCTDDLRPARGAAPEMSHHLEEPVKTWTWRTPVAVVLVLIAVAAGSAGA